MYNDKTISGEACIMLRSALYEQVINSQLTGELARVPDERNSVAPIDKAETSLLRSILPIGLLC